MQSPNHSLDLNREHLCALTLSIKLEDFHLRREPLKMCLSPSPLCTQPMNTFTTIPCCLSAHSWTSSCFFPTLFPGFFLASLDIPLSHHYQGVTCGTVNSLPVICLPASWSVSAPTLSVVTPCRTKTSRSAYPCRPAAYF